MPAHSTRPCHGRGLQRLAPQASASNYMFCLTGELPQLHASAQSLSKMVIECMTTPASMQLVE